MTAVKRLIAKTSLQLPYSDQILTPKMMFQYCVSKIQDIYIAQENLNSTRLFLETRFDCLSKSSAQYLAQEVFMNLCL